MNYFVCHYHEIGLKGKNRKFFENKLIENIKQILNPEDFNYVKRISGRILIKLSQPGIEKQKTISAQLKNVFGIAYFAFAQNSKQDIESIKQTAYNLLKDKSFKNFRITSKRAEKDFIFSSPQINEKVGAFIVENLNKKVNLENPDITCFIEIVEKYSFIYIEKMQGLGGLPVGTSGKAIALFSGGIDSPVAAYYAMKRGIKNIFVHFHAYPYTNKASIEKVYQLIKILNKFQNKSKLYLIPFGDIQKQIMLKTPAKFRVNLYRRMMMRIAEKIAEKENCETLITGESVGQVASQTLENLKSTQQATSLLVLRPLIGFDKQEIINKAEQIDTYKVSIQPYTDCCSRFLPKHPATKAKIKPLQKAEEKLDIKKLINTAIKKSNVTRLGRVTF